MKGGPLRTWTAGCLLLLLGAAPARAQTPDECRAELTRQGVHRHGVDPCTTLAIQVATMSASVRAAVDEILRNDEAAVPSVFGPRDLQPRQPQQPALSGTSAQGQAVPAVQPAALAAGSLAVFGSDAGENAVAAFTVNPAVLLLGDAVGRSLARLSRFADVTLFVPVTNVSPGDDPDGEASDRNIRYFGVRARLNIVGLAAGNDLWDDARALVSSWITQRARDAEHVRVVLAAAPDLSACVDSLLEGDSPAVVRVNCGREVNLHADLREAERLRTEFSRIRRAADARYFGADIRFDVGDPTMGAVRGASGAFLFAGLAYGRRLTPEGIGAGYALRSRLGVRHARLDEPRSSEFAAEGALGLQLERELGDENQIQASAGLEFRYGNADDDLVERFQSNHLMARASFLLPVTSANSLSINVGIPLAGEISPVLSVNFDWGLLLPENRDR